MAWLDMMVIVKAPGKCCVSYGALGAAGLRIHALAIAASVVEWSSDVSSVEHLHLGSLPRF